MLHHDDLKWIAKTSTELNTVLQQIARYADLMKRHKGDDYIDQLNQQVEIATQSAQALFNRVTSKILESTRPLSPNEPAATSAVPAPGGAGEAKESTGETAPGIPSQIAVLNPDGPRELILIID